MSKLVILSVILVASIGVLLWASIEAASIPVLRIADLKNGASKPGEDALVDEGKVIAIESYAPLRFTVAPEKDPTNVVLVTSETSVPENFKIGSSVSLRGVYEREKNVFVAYRISTQCPSRYEASKEGEKQGAYPAAGGYAAPLDPRKALENAGAPKVTN